MPKTKKIEENSDSDSGPDDRNPPPSKKAKDGPSKTDGNDYFELDRNRRVSLSTFKGKQYLNIREYYQDKSSGEWRPGKSGITLTKKEWNQLLELQPKINFND
ncbi:CLUMA_CG020831, isoform A [Clunio marinus]|uniref:CLUMA_CG020831, isoform A n=1 Tax=Clunio marinus TaxID=568069 RepID=A0A1J1JB52_9DIPT|nr:CLUMA_CG020831, isoform A [Clunio marinus]